MDIVTLKVILSLLVLAPNWAFSSTSLSNLFRRGEEERAKNFSVKESCQKLPAALSTFCLEGYYYKDIELDLFKQISTGTRRNLIFPKKSDGESARIAWSLALGRLSAFHTSSQFKRKQTPELLKQRKYGNYFVDGWMQAAFLNLGFKKSLKQCQKLFGQRHTCLWGMGKAFYKNRIPLKSIRQVEKEFVSGFLFAKSFGKANTSIKKGNAHPGILISNFIKQLGISEKNRKKQCIEKHHPVECLFLF